MLSVFGCLNCGIQSHIVEIRHDRESFMQTAGEQAQQTPVFPFSSPRRREVPKWPSVQLIKGSLDEKLPSYELLKMLKIQ